ncbi:ABC transporter ATP-binding protein [Streptomyces sp. G-5]|uniref:ABC transporter ATP-binding protein n=1 Tax=Streptomyces sp. G-5 TaxID=2977231 RepID=UPI0021CF1081|nr:ABC transporter ATP-binding protein [Streptomyces sp. G-5]MCU4746768.1 ABC transporter ATP-binding protein [Streptomyces sp. G-5]
MREDDRTVSAAPGEPALRLDRVSRTYPGGRAPALDGIDLEVPRARFLAVLGRSGSGKSTLLRCAAGLERPTGGAVHLGGVPLAGLRATALTRLRRDRIGFVFQELNLVDSLTVLQNAALPLLLAGAGEGEATWARALRVLEEVGLADRAAEAPGRLSGGQLQRVAIARALITEPDIIFADEPTGALDPVTAEGVLALLRRAVDAHGHTVVMVTHDPVAAGHADEAIVLDGGRIVRRLERPSAGQVLGALRAVAA